MIQVRLTMSLIGTYDPATKSVNSSVIGCGGCFKISCDRTHSE